MHDHGAPRKKKRTCTGKNSVPYVATRDSVLFKWRTTWSWSASWATLAL